VQKIIQGAGTEGSFSGRIGQQGGQINRVGHVVKHETEMRLREQVLNIFAATGNKIVETDDIMALRQEAVTEMGTQETRPAGDQA